MNALINRLDLIQPRLESDEFLNNSGLGNEIGFWIFDYPAQHELVVREHLHNLTQRLQKRGYRFAHVNLFQIVLQMLESRGLFERACSREKQVGVEGLRKNLSAVLSQQKVARFIAEQHPPQEQAFLMISGLGSAWPLIRGHELLSALQDVMGPTPLVLFYPGEYSGLDLHPFGMIESRNYYRAFKLVPEKGDSPLATVYSSD